MIAGGRGRSCTPATRPTPRRCCSSRWTDCRRGVDDAVERVVAIGRAARRPHRPRRGRRGRAALLWKGRKSAFGAVARIAPELLPARHRRARARGSSRCCGGSTRSRRAHDLVVLNVFHAGDGNLHPLLVFDAREPGVIERVHAAGDEIVRASLEAGGVLSGEHGIGIEKRDLMPLHVLGRTISTRRPGCARRSTPTASPTRARCSRGIALRRAGSACPTGAWV